LADLIITDKLKDKPKKWESGIGRFKHDENNPDCLHCKYVERVNSIPTKTIKKKVENGTFTLTKIKIVYGSDDDVIGWVLT